MQGQGDNKHSIDSDDEEDDREKFATFDKMAEDNELLEGQEEDTVAQDGEIKITPFNLKEEQQEGSFSKDGNFVWNKKDEVKDAWLDDVDMQKVSTKDKVYRTNCKRCMAYIVHGPDQISVPRKVNIFGYDF